MSKKVRNAAIEKVEPNPENERGNIKKESIWGGQSVRRGGSKLKTLFRE